MTTRIALDNERRNLLQEIAAATLADGGIAFKWVTRQVLPPADVWSFPKYPGRTVILPPDIDLVQALAEFITRNDQFLSEPDCWLGTWIHPQTHEFYLDIATGCPNLEEAQKTALEISQCDGRRIVALYNSKRKETVYL